MKFFYLVTLLLSVFFTNAQTRKYVTQNGSGSKDGSSWANAWDAKIFADTLNTQPAGTEIWVAKGMYRPTKDTLGILIPDNITSFSFPIITNKRTFLIPTSAKVIGGFAGTEITINDRIKSKIFGENITYLDGTYPFWNTADVTNSSNIVTLKNSSENTLLDGFQLRNFSNWAILINSTGNFFSNPQISNCSFGTNAGGSFGGILINTPGTILSKPKIGNCFFNTVNRSNFWPIGAGNNCTPLINSCVFITDPYDNMCINLNVQSSNGFISSHGASISNCTFYSKTAVYNPQPTINTNGTSIDTVFINNCIFWNDAAANQGYVYHLGSGLFSVRNTFLQAQTYPSAVNPAYQSGNTTVNPQFKNSPDIDGPDKIYGTADDGLQLKDGSPCINYGLNDSLPAFSVKDILGNSRISGCRVDIGAYEYQFTANNIVTLPETSSESCSQSAITGSSVTFGETLTCNVFATLAPSGINPVSGNLNVCVAKNASVPFVNGIPYVQRRYNIEPSVNPSFATARITLYFTQLDFDNYNAVATGFSQLPTSPTDATGKSNLKIEQGHGTSVTGVPGTYSGSTVFIDPDDNDIVWNSTSFIWEVSFNVTGFSGFFIRTAAAVPGTSYFRSRQTGDWDDRYTWESSPVFDFSSGVISPANVIPDYRDNGITILTGHTVSLRQHTTLDQMIINPGGTLLVNPNVIVTVTDGPGTDLVIKPGGNMTVKSKFGTASIGNSTGTISGNITIERYITNRRAWRLLSVPFRSSTQTIKSSWMENGSSATGYGTQITTFAGDPNAANFDGVKGASSIRTYSSDNFISDAIHTPNTANNIFNNSAYFLFVRGDRSIDRTISGASASTTTLRITGEVNAGDVSGAGITGTNFSLIPNPYPSQINFDAVKSITANSSVSTFYVWDVTLGAVGNYRTVQITGNAVPYTYTATPGGQNNNWRFIESGTAFFIAGNKTIDFTENTKSSSVPPSSMLRTADANETGLAIDLSIVNSNNTTSLADGVRISFNNLYANNVDKDDAKKISGFDLQLGIKHDKEILSVEKRANPKADDIIPLKLANAAPGNYQLQIQPINLSNILDPYIIDTYLNSRTPINKISSTNLTFNISSDISSANENRFNIVFAKPEEVNLKPLIVIYPNPIENGIIKLQMKNMPKGDYTFRLLNNLGQIVLITQINHSVDGVEIINSNKIKGIFTLEVNKPDNTKSVNKLIIN